MAVDLIVPRSRRALLVAGAGAVAATAAQALGNPVPARGANGDPVLVGGTHTGTLPTTLNNTGGGHGIKGVSSDGVGVNGTSSGGAGVYAISTSSYGVVAESTSGPAVLAVSAGNLGIATQSGATDKPVIQAQSHGNNTGVLAFSGTGAPPDAPAKTGVYGYASQDFSAVGVLGRSAAGTGIKGVSSSADGYGVIGSNEAETGGAGVYGGTAATRGETAGVIGQVQSPDGFGILGDTQATEGTARAIVGHAPGGTGILGWSGAGGSHPGGVAGTGVFGYGAIDTGSVGVRGESPAGTGGQFVSASGNALRVSGKARFNRSGKASVAKSRTHVDVTVPGGIASNTVVNATIQMYRAGVAVAGVRLNYPSAGKARIYLTKVASTTSSTPVAWIATEYGP